MRPKVLFFCSFYLLPFAISVGLSLKLILLHCFYNIRTHSALRVIEKVHTCFQLDKKSYKAIQSEFRYCVVVIESSCSHGNLTTPYSLKDEGSSTKKMQSLFCTWHFHMSWWTLTSLCFSFAHFSRGIMGL